MTITRYTPWAGQNGLQEEMKQAFERFFGGDESDQSNVVTSQWMPRVDIREEDKRFVILADIPGVDPKNIEVHMDRGILSIKGERSAEHKTRTKRASSRASSVRTACFTVASRCRTAPIRTTSAPRAGTACWRS